MSSLDSHRKFPSRIDTLLVERKRQKIKKVRHASQAFPEAHLNARNEQNGSDVSSITSNRLSKTISPICAQPHKMGSAVSGLFTMTAARADPFKTLPVQWTSDLDENFDFLVNDFGPSMFGYRANDKGIDIFKSQAALTLSDPAAFHALMTIATITRDRLAGRTLPGVSAVWHRVEALRLVNERLASGQINDCLTEGSLYAIMGLTGISRQWNAVGSDEFQSSALDQLILQKGGLNVVGREYPVLELAMFSLAVLTPSILRPDLYVVSGSETDQINHLVSSRSLLYGLLGFVRSVEELQTKNQRDIYNVRFAFSPESVIYGLLAYPPKVPGIQPQKMVQVQLRLRLQILLFVFSVLIWGTPGMYARFMEHLQFMLQHSWVWKDSLRMLQWLINANSETASLIFPRQSWQSYELLCAVDSLQPDLQDDLRQYLMSTLTGRAAVRVAADEIMSQIRSEMFASHPDEA